MPARRLPRRADLAGINAQFIGMRAKVADGTLDVLQFGRPFVPRRHPVLHGGSHVSILRKSPYPVAEVLLGPCLPGSTVDAYDRGKRTRTAAGLGEVEFQVNVVGTAVNDVMRNDGASHEHEIPRKNGNNDSRCEGEELLVHREDPFLRRTGAQSVS